MLEWLAGFPGSAFVVSREFPLVTKTTGKV
jgi:hypothetical protein